MEFVADREDLVPALQTVTRAVSSRTTLPVLSGILIEVRERDAVLVGNDLEIGIECRIPVNTFSPGATVVTASYLNEIVRRIPFGDIRFRQAPGSGMVEIRWEKSEFMINTASPEQFPRLPEGGPDEGTVIAENALRNLFRRTTFCVSKSETMPTVLTGVLVSMDGETLTALSTDGFRVAYARGALEEGREKGPALSIVPGRAVTELGRILGSGGEVRVSYRENQIFFDLGETLFCSRLLDGEYPRVLDLIPKEYGVKVTMKTQEFHDACERVALVSETRRQGQVVCLEIGESSVLLSSSSAEVGKASEEVPAEVSAAGADVSAGGLEILFNARFLVEGLKQIETEEAVFELINSESAARLRPAVGEDFFYVVLPMRA